MVADSSNSKASSSASAVISHVPYMERMGRKLPVTSTGAALATLAVVPVWAVTILPLTVAYQVGKAAVKSVLPKSSNAKDTHLPPLDSGYQVDPAQIIPRPDRTYDVVVLGATGFVGGLAVRHLAETACRIVTIHFTDNRIPNQKGSRANSFLGQGSFSLTVARFVMIQYAPTKGRS
jgi:hypothetical protein